MDFNMIGNLMQRIEEFIDGAYANVHQPILFTATALMVIGIGLLGIIAAVDPTENLLASGIRKVFVFGFFLYLIDQWQLLTGTIYDSAIWLGLRASGNQLSVMDFQNVSGIARTGINLAQCEFQWMHSLTGAVDTIINLPQIIFLYVSAMIIICCFFVMSILVFLAIIEMKILSIVAFFLIPWGTFDRTAWIAEHGIRYVVSAAVKVATMAIVVSFAIGFISEGRAIHDCTGSVPDLDQAAATWFGSLVMVVMLWQLPNLTSRVVSGGAAMNLHGIGRFILMGQAGAAGALSGNAGSGASGTMAIYRAAAAVPPLPSAPGRGGR